MNILALETATRRISVALRYADGAMLERHEDSLNGGSARVLPWVHELLGEAGIGMQQIDGIAFGAGPGSFTGLRLACGVAQGLAFGLECPVLGVSTLLALAQASGEQSVFACLDARMGEVYVAAYERSGDAWVERAMPRVLLPQDATLPAGGQWGQWVGCGDGFAAYAASLPAPARIRADVSPTAAAVAELALPHLARGEGGAAATAQPIYVRDKVALTTAERLTRGGMR